MSYFTHHCSFPVCQFSRFCPVALVTPWLHLFCYISLPSLLFLKHIYVFAQQATCSLISPDPRCAQSLQPLFALGAYCCNNHGIWLTLAVRALTFRGRLVLLCLVAKSIVELDQPQTPRHCSRVCFARLNTVLTCLVVFLNISYQKRFWSVE